jgi:hypothetical protein
VDEQGGVPASGAVCASASLPQRSLLVAATRLIMSTPVEDVAQCLLVYELRDLPVVGVSPPPEAQPASYGPRERRKLRVRTTWRDAHESYYNVRSSCRAAAFL